MELRARVDQSILKMLPQTRDREPGWLRRRGGPSDVGLRVTA
jgi:hypothetical protein